MALLDSLNWRYATKVFDSSKKLSTEQMDALLEALRLAPSSYGMQPWKFVVVDSVELREKLKPVSWNQAQITDASHLIVLCRPDSITAQDVDRLMEATATARGIEVSSLDGYKQMVMGVTQMSPEQQAVWASKQAYLALGVLLTAAAEMGIDACPMEGFDPAQYDEILGLNAKGLHSVVVCPVGFRSADDKYATAKKVRYPREEVVVRL